MYKDNTVIVTRHQGLVEWLKTNGIEGEVIERVYDTNQIEGKHAVGVLPPHLACLCKSVTLVELPYRRADQDGKDLTVGEMEIAGARMSTYIIRKANRSDLE